MMIACGNNDSAKKQGKGLEDEKSIQQNVISSKILNDSLLSDLTTKIEEQYYPNIHSVLIAKNGSLVYDEYFDGVDQNWGKELGEIKFTDSTLHDVRSVTKSIVSTLMGIAIKKGLITSESQKVSDFFPDREFNGMKKNWTIEHFLTMKTGLDWNEKIPYSNPKNDEIQMTYSKDPINFILSKKLLNEPGLEFNYSGGATQILSAIIENASGMSIAEFAEQNLFGPLEINEYEWNKFSYWGGSENYSAASGLRLLPKDMLKIGLLYRNNGLWDGRQVLNNDWIENAFKQHVEFKSDFLENDGYGYQFWVWADKISNQMINFKQANGNGDQNIYWDLENDIIVIVTAGNYNNFNNIKNNSIVMLKQHIYPALLN